MGATISSVVGVDHLPHPIRSLHELDRVDYADLFTLSTTVATGRTPEQWARAVLEQGSAARRLAFIPWRMLLGLRLGPSDTPGYVHGWRVAATSDDWIRLVADSWLVTCHAVTQVAAGQVSVALFVRYDHRAATVWWPLLSAVHRRAMPLILQQGSRVVRSGPGDQVRGAAEAAQ